ncbi:head-tail connector protein [Paucibacter sp. R3-3]|uniref:Head-tail connector protein n=1 Tax=Roseateles agri TaxID=3098619 RepID=A0ABU5DQA6_9BURK|nr:head-tail connector protein [Paucibacter sp. R3-3]MDY0748508.1 head-tail connector protein [Paucibacter sp. R3-3]
MLTTIRLEGVEPVSLDEAKAAARVDGNDLDGFIQGAIGTARECAEHITGRTYRQQVQRQSFADWPASTEVLRVFGATAVSVQYWDGTQFVQLDDADVAFFEAGIGGAGTSIAPALGSSWPALGSVAGGPRVRVDVTSGPTGDEDAIRVPESVKTYIKAQVAAWLKNPEAIAGGTLVENPLLATLLDRECLWV